MGRANVHTMRVTLKSILPRSLYGRAALILLVPVITIQFIVSVAFIQRHYEGVTRQMSRGVAVELRFILAELSAEPDLRAAAARAAVLETAFVMDVDLVTEVPKEADLSFFDLSGREVVRVLHEEMPELHSVLWAAQGTGLQVFATTPLGPVRMSLDRKRVSASNPHQLLVLMVITSFLMTVIAFVFLRNQLSPITRLARAAEAFGKGQMVHYRARGANEVRAAGAAFLDMRARIERQIETRTLMLSGISHDLRTPLTRMKLGLSFLPEDAETLALMGDVTDMERLVDEFLAFARGDAMEVTELADPADIVRRAVENAQRAGMKARVWDAAQVGPVALRPQAISRALDNLIGNAVRYGTQAEVSVQVTDRWVRLVVEDDGPGIPEAARDIALEPFQRLDAARDPNRGGGVGLGLSIAADIARSHGGALRLGSSERLGGLRAELSIAR